MDNQIYQASLEALTQLSVPLEIAEQASIVVANDKPGEPNFGRTEADQEAIAKLLPYLQEEAE